MKPEVCVCVCVWERERERESLSLIQDLQHMMMTTKRKLILCLTTEVIKASSHMCMSSSPNLGQTYSQIKRKTGGHQPRKFWNYFPPPPHHHHHHHHHSCEGMMSQEKRPGTSNWRHMTTESKATHNHSVSRSQKHPPTTHHSFLLVTDWRAKISDPKWSNNNIHQISHQSIGAPFNGMHAWSNQNLLPPKKNKKHRTSNLLIYLLTLEQQKKLQVPSLLSFLLREHKHKRQCVWFLCVHLSFKSRVLRLCRLCGQAAIKSELNEKVSIWVVGSSLFLSFLSGYMLSSNLCHLSAPWTPLFLLPQKNPTSQNQVFVFCKFKSC